MDTVLGFILLAAWAALLLWAFAQIALSARQDERAQHYLAGLVFGCALGVGIMLMFFRHIHGLDSMGHNGVGRSVIRRWLLAQQVRVFA
jgi:hypothetical protein